VTAAALSGLLVLALAGCTTPAPEPTPTPGFSSEEEAFAAAEETYRAYVDAVNARRTDPDTLPEPTDFLVGDALEAEIDTEQLMSSEGLSITGETVITGAQRESWDDRRGELTLIVCVDSSGTVVRNTSGVDVTPPSRPVQYALSVRFDLIGDEFLVASTRQTAEATC
jgi:hypothetical protein